MNILPFLFSFLIIFSLSLNSSSERKQSTLLFCSSLEKLRLLIHQNITKHESREYQRSYRKIDPSGKLLLPETPKEKPRTYFRKDKCSYEEQKLNLTQFSLDSPLYKAAEKLIKTLYEHTSFYYEGLEIQIVEGLLKRDKIPLAELFENNTSLDAIFYKMLKGTMSYNIEERKGYPSLLDYCSFKAPDNNLYYNDLSKPVLEALVGSKLMALIEEKEKEDNKPLSKEAFEALVKDSNVKTLHFGSKKKGKKTACVDDDNTMILRI